MGDSDWVFLLPRLPSAKLGELSHACAPTSLFSLPPLFRRKSASEENDILDEVKEEEEEAEEAEKEKL